MIVKRVTGTHSSIIMAINKLYDHGAGRRFVVAASDFSLAHVTQFAGLWVVRSGSSFFYKCSKYIKWFAKENQQSPVYVINCHFSGTHDRC